MDSTTSPQLDHFQQHLTSIADQGEEEDVCRICRSEAEPSRPLLHPCKCSGSIKYVHQDCLLQWLKHSGMQTCEVCSHPFSFTNKYRSNAPQALSVGQLARGLYLQARGVGEYAWRVVVCASLWLVFQPLIMAGVWRAMLVWPLQGVRMILPSMPISFSLLLELCQGSFIAIVLAILHIFTSQFMDLVAQLWSDLVRQGTAAFQEVCLEFTLERNSQSTQVTCQQLQPTENFHVGEVQPVNTPQVQHVDNVGNIFDQQRGAEGQPTLGEERGSTVAQQGSSQEDEEGEDVDDEDYSMEDSEGWEEYTIGDNENEEQQLFGIGLDGEGDLEVQDVSIEEFIGLTGPMSGLLLNFAGLTMANAFMLFLILFVPLQVGRVHLYGFSYFASFMGLSPGQPVASDAVALLENLFKSWSLWDWGKRTIESWHTYFPFEFPVKFVDLVQEHSLFPTCENLTALTLGYITVILIGVIGGLGYAFKQLLNAAADKNLSLGVVFKVVQRFSSKLIHNVSVHTPQAMLRLKLSIMFVIELGLFSYMVGYWIEVGALPMWGGNYRENWEFWRERPLFSGIAHWLMGLGYVLCFHTLIRSARRILKPTALTFLKDPESPDFDPWEEMKNEQIFQTLWRLGTATLVHSISIFSSVHLPIRIASFVYPSLFPLRLRFSEPLLDVFLGLGLFQIGAPALLPHINITALIDEFMINWLLNVGRILKLEQYLLPNHFLPVELHLWEDEEDQNVHNEQDGEVAESDDEDEMGSLQQQQYNSISLRRRMFVMLGSLYSKVMGINRNRRNNHRIYKRFKRLRLRVFALANFWFLSIISINTCLCLLPLTIGRIFGKLIGHPQIVDLHAFAAGMLAIIFGALAVRLLSQHRLTPNVQQISVYISRFVRKAVKVLIGMFLWQGIVSYLIGFLVIKTLFPFFGTIKTVLWSEPLQEISIGLACLIAIKRVAITRLQLWPQLRQDDSWERNLALLNEHGWQNLDVMWSLQNLIIPALAQLSGMAIVPFTVSYILSKFELSISDDLRKWTFQYCYSIWVLTWLGLRFSGQLAQVLYWLHDSIRDELYLEDRVLNNLDSSNLQQQEGAGA